MSHLDGVLITKNYQYANKIFMKPALPAFIHSLELCWPFPQPLPDCRLAMARFSAGQPPAAADFAALKLLLLDAHPKRQSEFLAGRHCARAALQALGYSGSLPQRQADSRQPRWPEGCCGSISHSHGQAAALAGYALHWLGLGLDLERLIAPGRALKLARTLLTASETLQFQQLDASQAARWLTLVFSAKESLFKALNPVTGLYFGFQDAELVQWKAGLLQMRLLRQLSADIGPGLEISGQWAALDDALITLVALPANGR